MGCHSSSSATGKLGEVVSASWAPSTHAAARDDGGEGTAPAAGRRLSDAW